MISQSEADRLFRLDKIREDDTNYSLPDFGGSLTIPLVCLNKKEKFILDIRRRRIELQRNTFQNRARNVIILARLDLNSTPHRNPDGQEVGPTHIHLYKEDYGDKWAYPLPNKQFPNLNDPWMILHNFMSFCNITRPPLLIKGLCT